MEQRKNTANEPLLERRSGVERNQILQRLPQPKLSSFSKQTRLSAAFRGMSILVSPLMSINILSK